MYESKTTAIGFPTCEHCGMIHTGVCSRVAAIEYHENGAVKRVEYHQPYEMPECKAKLVDGVFEWDVSTDENNITWDSGRTIVRTELD